MARADAYRRLQRHLDRMPVGFPATKSGIEIRILQRLFSPEDVVIALELSAIPEPVHVIHRRLRRRFTREQLAERLTDMAARGLIERLPHPRGPRYGKSLLALGIYERQLPRLSADLERDVRAYMEQAFGRALHAGRTPQLRTIPVGAAVDPARQVTTFDDLRAFVHSSPGPFAVMTCICRHGKDLLGEPCRQTSLRETCLTIGVAAEGTVDWGPARFITRDDVLGLLDRADQEGLVLQPQNTKAPLFVCMCCGCCCGILASAKRLPEPARSFSANYLARVDQVRCRACGTCQARCQMDAIEVQGDSASVTALRCIGCGLCVTSCPSEAVALQPVETQRVPPDDTPALYARIYAERFGRFAAAAALGRHLLGGKV